jgi:hypothetical protein
MGAHVKLVLFNTTSSSAPVRAALGPSVSTAAVASNAVDTLSLNPRGVTSDLRFGNNNVTVLQQYFSIADVAALDTLTETSF